MLSAAVLLRVWEVARVQRPGAAAMTLLLGLAGLSRERASQLSVGERDRTLMEVRRHLFGPTIECRSDCPGCSEMLECTIDLVQLCQVYVEPVERERIVEVDGQTLHWRLPTAGDLAAISACSSSKTAQDVLIELCLVKGVDQEQTVGDIGLSTAVEASFSEFVLQCDTAAESAIELVCPMCRRIWTETFDIMSLLWADLDILARQLLREVHDLASAFGWTEETILNLSAARRAAYLELCGS